ncbi:ABC transporter substrate-binding protein [Microbacterium nanhaiense]|uniref:ABC transporter substrate-binding protein n=1 Tax=Microbacterium nanhaiense TaxID=1301026 RepID=A0ABQ2MZI0_9MICO|nr:MetQ/NlpA family ABC transporter substrate-binding protein [Microbacterium nanhaiense]GGO60804.1 ABC transporter substrate-binding protein [Microbacterium nanhaiense]
MARFTRAFAPLAIVGILAAAGCAGGDAGVAAGTEDDPIKLGVVGASDPYWDVYEKAVEAEGISLEIVDFSEYSLVNPALSEGELDINQFQHIQYLADYNVHADDDLQPIGATAIYPLGLYSTNYDSIDAIPDGETVVVPDDTVNQARGLLVLQKAGLVTLKDGGNSTSTLQDVIEEESRVTVEALKADLTVTSLPDVAAAIVNNDFLEAAGLKAGDELIADDPADPAAQPYVNIFAVRADDVEDETLNKLVEIYHSTPEVLDGLRQQSGDSAVFLTTPAADLQASLEETEKNIAALD